MKRVKSACIMQTLHFMSKEDLGHDYTLKTAQQEVEKYKTQLKKAIVNIK